MGSVAIGTAKGLSVVAGTADAEPAGAWRDGSAAAVRNGESKLDGRTAECVLSLPREGPPANAGEDALFIVRAAVAAERARIARELHDRFSKSLLGVAMLASLLAAPDRGEESAPPRRRLRELALLARQAVGEARDAVNDLGDDALADNVRDVATAWGVGAGVKVAALVAPIGVAPEELRGAIVHILWEALRNVEKHAEASLVRVCLRRTGDRISLTVTDDGRGFTDGADVGDVRSATRPGLTRMRDVAERVGGELVVRSRPGAGTRIALHLAVPGPVCQQLRAVPSEPVVRVVIADENPVIRLGLRAIFERSPDVEVVAEAADGSEITEKVLRHRPDVLLLDARMEMIGKLAAIREISRSTEVIVLSFLADASLLMRAVGAGTQRYAMDGSSDPGALLQSVLEAARRDPRRTGTARVAASAPPSGTGEAGAQPRGDQPRAGQPHGGLTPRERDVMNLIAEGLSNRQIATRLVITEKTVKNHISRIYQNFGVSGRSGAVARWRDLARNDDPAPGIGVCAGMSGLAGGGQVGAPGKRDRGQSGVHFQFRQ